MTHTAYEPSASDPRIASGCTSFALTKLAPSAREGQGWVGSAGAAAARLKPFGTPDSVRIRSVGERGRMEVSSAPVVQTDGSRRLMYRSLDGKIQEYLLFRP
jgi:hypothetical protein